MFYWLWLNLRHPSMASQFYSSTRACKFHNMPWPLVLLLTQSSSFYRPSAYALAQVVVDIPLVLIQVALFNLIVYLYVSHISSELALTIPSMANLARSASQFFICFLFIFTLAMTMYSFFRALGALCPSLDAGMLHISLHLLNH
jgi:ABC-type multidrug transport system permease subunit